MHSRRVFLQAAAALFAVSACSPAASTPAPKPTEPAVKPTTGAGATAPTSAPAAAASGSTNAGPSTRQPTTIRLSIADPVQITYSPVFIAQKEGFYKEQGIELDIKNVNPPTATQALIAGQFDVAHAASPAISAALQGAPLKMIFTIAEPASYWLVAKPEIKTWADLKGKKVAVASTTGTQVLDAARLFKAHGVDVQADGVQFVVPGGASDADRYAGMKGGAIDAGLFTGLGGIRLLSEGYNLVGDFHELRSLDSTHWTTDAYIQSKPEVVQGYVTATLQGMQIFKRNEQRALKWLTEQFEGNAASAKQMRDMALPLFSDTGVISNDGLEEGVRYKREVAEKASSVTGQQMIRMDFAQKANDELKRLNFQP